jgi:DNA-directed RNA polymerase specialized sigma24 family protein
MASTAVLEAPSSPSGVPEEERGLSHLAFTRLLEWLDNGTDSHGQTYLEIRRRLTAYFDRRDRRFPDDLADETLSRIGRTLERDGAIAITPQARYCYVVAKFVLLEDIRRERRHPRAVESSGMISDSWNRGHVSSLARDEESADRESRLACLDRCLQEIGPQQRALIVDYHRDEGRAGIERRRELAKEMGISMNALGIRACRIRAALEAQMAACCGARQSGRATISR